MRKSQIQKIPSPYHAQWGSRPQTSLKISHIIRIPRSKVLYLHRNRCYHLISNERRLMSAWVRLPWSFKQTVSSTWVLYFVLLEQGFSSSDFFKHWVIWDAETNIYTAPFIFISLLRHKPCRSMDIVNDYICKFKLLRNVKLHADHGNWHYIQCWASSYCFYYLQAFMLSMRCKFSL